jgi:hypothetical protein
VEGLSGNKRNVVRRGARGRMSQWAARSEGKSPYRRGRMERSALKKLDGETAHASRFSLDLHHALGAKSWVRWMMLMLDVGCENC